jgi:hypothetical protein
MTIMPAPPSRKRAKLQKAKSGTAGASRSFRDFARKLRADNPALAAFKPHAMAADFPAASSWQEVRAYLVRAAADHEALVGARMAWREFRLRSVQG